MSAISFVWAQCVYTHTMKSIIARNEKYQVLCDHGRHELKAAQFNILKRVGYGMTMTTTKTTTATTTMRREEKWINRNRYKQKGSQAGFSLLFSSFFSSFYFFFNVLKKKKVYLYTTQMVLFPLYFSLYLFLLRLLACLLHVHTHADFTSTRHKLKLIHPCLYIPESELVVIIMICSHYYHSYLIFLMLNEPKWGEVRHR